MGAGAWHGRADAIVRRRTNAIRGITDSSAAPTAVCIALANAEELRRKIAVYRRYLAEGVSGENAALYLREIKRMEAELDAIAGDSDKRE